MASCQELEPQRISLSLTASYAPAWKLWEGLRELVQNWHDGLLSADLEPATRSSSGASSLEFSNQGGSGSDGLSHRYIAKRAGQEVGWCEFMHEENKLIFVNKGVGLGRQVLLLGYSKKAQHHDVIGSFGEGLKVGAVALLRKGLRLRMLTKAEDWTFELALDPAFGEKVLTVEASRRQEVLDLELEGLPPSLDAMSLADTATVLEGISPAEWRQLSERFLFLKPPAESVTTEVGRLLLDERHTGSFFVRGVWINHDPDLAAGVDLYDIRLDRDRAAVLKKSELQHQVSSMWVRAVHHMPSLQQRYYELLAGERQCSDIAFADLYLEEDAAEALAAAFRQRHGDAIPVSLKDANSARAQQMRASLHCTTVVCTNALMAVLKKGGVKCDLVSLLQEGEHKARQFVPLADLSEDETCALMRTCSLVELADPSAAPLAAMVDVFESPGSFSVEALVKTAEAFELGGRLELDRRSLHRQKMHDSIGNCLCLAGCSCREGFLACAILDSQAGGRVSSTVRGRLVASLASRGSEERAVLRCPDLGRLREDALQRQNGALDKTLCSERTAHADELKSLQRRVSEAEKELRVTEFKIMDATDAERKLREAWEPELVSLRAKAQQLEDFREQAKASETKADLMARQLAFARQQYSDLGLKIKEVEEAAARRVSTAEESSTALRRALVQRRQLLQKMVHQDSAAPLVSLVDSCELQAAVQEIRDALRAEMQTQRCCVCMDGPAKVVLMPCRHQRLCVTCAGAVRVCPVCRAGIDSRLEVFD